MYWLICYFDTGATEIVYAAVAPERGDACDGYDTMRDAVQAQREWQSENE